MKHILFIFLLLFTSNAFAKSDLWALLKHSQISLTYGIEIPPEQKYNDFSVITTASQQSISVLNSEPMSPLTDLSGYWYHFDFEAEPFDGRIEVSVVGEPSASTTTTLLISCTLLVLMVYIRKRPASLAQ